MWIDIDAYPFIIAVGRRLGTLAVGTLLGETCAFGLVHCVYCRVKCVLTKDVEVLDELPLGASLVRRTKDVDEKTTGEKTAEDTIRFDGRLVQAASLSTTTVLVGALLDTGTAVAGGTLRDGRNAEGKGEGSDDSREVHCDF